MNTATNVSPPPQTGERPKVVLIQDERFQRQVYPEALLRRISECVEWVTPPLLPGDFENADLSEVEVLFTGWGAPDLRGILAKAEKLALILFAGGSLRNFLAPEIWERKIRICSSYFANARPVAEYTVATAILGLKRAWAAAASYRGERLCQWPEGMRGANGAGIGLLSFGATSREVVRILTAAYDLRPFVWDPFVADEEILSNGAEPMGFSDIFQNCDVVSVHTPDLPETRHLVTGEHLRQLRPHATFINTARGINVLESDLTQVARERPDVQFVLDVTQPEPAAVDSPLHELPNVFLTPHIAGAIGNETQRLGEFMLEELQRFLRGERLLFEITAQVAHNSSHRSPLPMANRHQAIN